MSLVDDFCELFQGRTDAYGTEEGGCVRVQGDPAGAWPAGVRDHLDLGGEFSIGVYPMVDDHVHWGCIDFDEGEEESWAHAVNVQKVLEQFGVTAWVERSRSKGYHVWVFVGMWVPASTMRKALLAACQIVEAPTKEINPKQETLGDGQLGNYIRLPYPGWANHDHEPSSTRRTVIEDGRSLWPDEFAERALPTRCASKDLEPLVELYQPPKQHGTYVPVLPGSRDTLTDRMGGMAWTIWNDGPYPGGDRSTALTKLAHRIREDGMHTYQEALELLADANARWGKPQWGHEQVEKYVLRKVW